MLTRTVIGLLLFVLSLSAGGCAGAKHYRDASGELKTENRSATGIAR